MWCQEHSRCSVSSGFFLLPQVNHRAHESGGWARNPGILTTSSVLLSSTKMHRSLLMWVPLLDLVLSFHTYLTPQTYMARNPWKEDCAWERQLCDMRTDLSFPNYSRQWRLLAYPALEGSPGCFPHGWGSALGPEGTLCCGYLCLCCSSIIPTHSDSEEVGCQGEACRARTACPNPMNPESQL